MLDRPAHFSCSFHLLDFARVDARIVDKVCSGDMTSQKWLVCSTPRTMMPMSKSGFTSQPGNPSARIRSSHRRTGENICDLAIERARPSARNRLCKRDLMSQLSCNLDGLAAECQCLAQNHRLRRSRLDGTKRSDLPSQPMQLLFCLGWVQETGRRR